MLWCIIGFILLGIYKSSMNISLWWILMGVDIVVTLISIYAMVRDLRRMNLK